MARTQAERVINAGAHCIVGPFESGAALAIAQVPDDTMICRCEEVRFGAARAALADGLNDAGSVKRATRIGMGPCQGRYCRPLLEALIQEATGKAPDETSGFAPRPPFWRASRERRSANRDRHGRDRRRCCWRLRRGLSGR